MAVSNPTDRLLRAGAQVLCSSSGDITISAALSRSVTMSGAGGVIGISSLPAGAGVGISSGGLVLMQSAGGQSVTIQSNSGSVVISGSGAVTLTAASGQPVTIIAPGGCLLSATDRFGWLGRSSILSDADGNLRLTNSSQTGFSLLQFGGTSGSFGAIKGVTSGLQVRLASDSGFAQLEVGAVKWFLSTSGAGSAALGSNCPATTLTAPYRWVQGVADDGSIIYSPWWR